MDNRSDPAGLFLNSIVRWMNDPYFNIIDNLKYFKDYKQDHNTAIWLALALTFWDALTDYQTPDDTIFPMIDELVKISKDIYNKAKDILREHGIKDDLNLKEEEEIIENPSAHREYLKRWNSVRDWRDWRSAYLLAQYPEAQEFLKLDEILNINLDGKIEYKINYRKFIFFYCLGSIIKLSKTPENSEKQQENLRKFFEKLKDGGNEFYILRFILTGKKDENSDFNKIIEENIDLISFANYLIKLNSVRYKIRKEIIERIVELNKEKEKIEGVESKDNFKIKRGDLYKYAKGIIGLSSNMITTKNKEKYTEADGRAFVQNLAKLFHRYTGIDQLLKWLANLEDKSLAQRSINLLVPLCARYTGRHTINESNKKDIAAIANLFTPTHYLMLSDRCALGAQIAAYHFAIVPDPSAPITRVAILLARTNPDFRAALEGYSEERANWLMKEVKLQAALPIEILI